MGSDDETAFDQLDFGCKRKYQNTNTIPKTFWHRPLHLMTIKAANRRREGLPASIFSEYSMGTRYQHFWARARSHSMDNCIEKSIKMHQN